MPAPSQRQIDTLIGVLCTINIELVPAILIQEMVDMDPAKREAIRVILTIAKRTIDFVDERTTEDMVKTYYDRCHKVVLCEKCGETKIKEQECECVYLNR